MIFISITITFIYSVLILFLIKGFNQIRIYKTKNKSQKTNFSIIIPFRNEAKNLPNLLECLSTQNYDNHKFEVLLINDNSNDGYKKIINHFKSKHNRIDLIVIDNIRKTNSPKKDAITIGIKNSKYDWIITTDADCYLPHSWLKTFDDFIQSESPKMIVAPVVFQAGNKFLDNFQILDFLSLQGSTIGGFGINKPFLCNGANLCYSKTAFLKIDGFSGNESIASGDDIFLLEKMVKQYPEKLKYLKSTEAIATTKPEENLNQLVQQRIRWASKTTSYSNTFGKLVGTIVLITNVYLLILFTLAVFQNISWQHFSLFFLIKFNIDFVLLYKNSQFFKQQEVLKSYLLSSILHPIFTVIIAFFSFKKGYQWKGRAFKK